MKKLNSHHFKDNIRSKMLLLMLARIILGLSVLFIKVQCYNLPSDAIKNTTEATAAIQHPTKWRMIWNSNPYIKYSSKMTNFTFLPIENGTSTQDKTTEISPTEKIPIIPPNNSTEFSLLLVLVIISIIITMIFRKFCKNTYKLIRCNV